MTDFSSLVSSTGARGAYRSSQELSGLPGPAIAEDDSPRTSFSEMLRDASAEAVSTMREADVAAQKGMAGEISTQQVVEATIALESTVKVMVSMRDTFVEAYQEVLRMPI